MIRKAFKKNKKNTKLAKFIRKYNIPKEHLSVNRKAITRGLLIGIFIGFIPMPFQMVAVVLAGIFVIFNVPIAISMVWLSNPITMPFMYYMEYKTGAFLLREPLLHVELTMKWFEHHLSEIFVPLYVGTAFYAIIVSISVYYIVNWMWVYSVRQEKLHKKKRRKRN